MAGVDYGVLVFNERKLLKILGSNFVHKEIKFITGKSALDGILIGKKFIDADFISSKNFIPFNWLREDIIAGKYNDKYLEAIDIATDSSRYTKITIDSNNYYVVGGYIYNNDILKEYYLQDINEFNKEKFYRKSINKIKTIVK